MTTLKRMTSREAIATHLGMDLAELKEHHYQPGRWTRAVYSMEDGYYCAVEHNWQLPEPTRWQDGGLAWEEVPDAHINEMGWRIFKGG